MKKEPSVKYVPGEKSLRAPFIICADLECLLRKINIRQNNLEKKVTEKKATHRPSDYSLVTCYSFDKSKNERKYYRGEDCMKLFCKDLKGQATRSMMDLLSLPIDKISQVDKKNHAN